MRIAEQGSQLSIDISRPTREPYVIKYSATDSAGNEATPVALRFNVECASVSIFQLAGSLQLNEVDAEMFECSSSFASCDDNNKDFWERIGLGGVIPG